MILGTLFRRSYNLSSAKSETSKLATAAGLTTFALFPWTFAPSTLSFLWAGTMCHSPTSFSTPMFGHG